MSIESRPELGAFLRRGGYSAVLCVAVALLLGVQPGARFGVSLVHSLAIGGLCWLSIDGGRFVVARWLARRDAQRLDAREGWPGWSWMSLIIALGVPVAYVLGSRAADLIIGSAAPAPDAMPWRRYALPLLISITVSAVATGFFATRSRLFHARAEAEAARRAASEMQLRLLQAQLEPHMLFNTLADLVRRRRSAISEFGPDGECMRYAIGGERPRCAEYFDLADNRRSRPRLADVLRRGQRLRRVADPLHRAPARRTPGRLGPATQDARWPT